MEEDVLLMPFRDGLPVELRGRERPGGAPGVLLLLALLLLGREERLDWRGRDQALADGRGLVDVLFGVEVAVLFVLLIFILLSIYVIIFKTIFLSISFYFVFVPFDFRLCK